MSTSSLARRGSSRRHSTAVGVLGGTAAPTTAPTRASFAGGGRVRRQSEAPQRKRSSMSLRRQAWTLKYHDFLPDTLHFSTSRSFTGPKPEKFQ